MTVSEDNSRGRTRLELAKSVLLTFATALAFVNCALAAPKFKMLHSFQSNDGKDGSLHAGNLAFDPLGNLYGTASGGGTYTNACNGGCGAIFEVSRDARGKWTESVLHSFNAGVDGAFPAAGLTIDPQGNVYGTTTSGSGNNDGGTVVELEHDATSTTGWTAVVIHRFCHNIQGCRDGSNPWYAGVALDSAGRLYGTTRDGGAYRGGVAYMLALTSGRWKETILHSFCNPNCDDGYRPEATPILDKAGHLYGTTAGGGSTGLGIVFQAAQTPHGWNKITLHTFHGSDGSAPLGGLILDTVGSLYGTTAAGGTGTGCGSSGCGLVFKLTPDSHGQWKEAVLYKFTDPQNGAEPFTTLAMDRAGNLYGTAVGGGRGQCGGGGCGVAFKLAPTAQDTWKYTVLHRFTDAKNDGAEPFAGLVFDKEYKHLYGTTAFGGAANKGVVFELTP